MKKIVWNQVTTPAASAPGPALSLQRAGGINFNNTLSVLLGFPEKGVQFIQDEERPQDWYIQSSTKSDAFKPREKKLTAKDTFAKSQWGGAKAINFESELKLAA